MRANIMTDVQCEQRGRSMGVSCGPGFPIVGRERNTLSHR